MARAACALVVLCGLPGSGKSTLATSLQRHAKQQDPTVAVEVVSLDDIYLHLAGAGPFDLQLWRDSRTAALEDVESLLRDVAQGSGSRVVILDDNMYYRSMRYSMFQMARAKQAAFVQLYVKCDLRLALQRNAARQGPACVPPHVMQRMFQVFEEPNPILHHWEQNTLVLSSLSDGECDVAPVWTALSSMWVSAPPPLPSLEEIATLREEGRAANAASSLHNIDIRSRTLVTEAMAHMPAADKAQAASILNAARRQLLVDCRSVLKQAEYATWHDTSVALAELENAFERVCHPQ